MKLCPRCELWKPNALFIKPKARGGKCESCCTQNRRSGYGRKAAHIRTFQASPIDPSKEDKKLVALAKREMKRFKKRGSPLAERPYCFIAGNPTKGLS